MSQRLAKKTAVAHRGVQTELGNHFLSTQMIGSFLLQQLVCLPQAVTVFTERQTDTANRRTALAVRGILLSLVLAKVYGHDVCP